MTETIQPIDHPTGQHATAPQEISYEQFGVNFIHQVLHKDRVLRLVNDVLGDQIVLGPIGAGPARRFASFSVVGTYRPCKGEKIPGEVLTYRVYLPISVAFEVAMKVDRHRFNADVVVPLTLSLHVDAPLVIRWEIQTPAEDEVVIQLTSETRRGSILQKLAGLDEELRRFLVKVIRTELDKAYVHRATHLDMADILEGAWPAITTQFLPKGAADRLA